jgi:Protein of unknown function (DUF2934)
MKNQNFSQDQNQKLAAGSRSTAVDFKKSEVDFAPLSDEVTRKTHFSYVNQGSPQGHEVQHWLEAEAQLLEERQLTRIHGFHDRI